MLKKRGIIRSSLTSIEIALLGENLKPHDVMVKQKYLLFGRIFKAA